MRLRRNAFPLGLEVGLGALAASLLLTLVVLTTLAFSAPPTTLLLHAGVAGATASVLVACVAAWVATRFAARLRRLTAAALAAEPGALELGGAACTELSELARTIDAMLRRTRVADEMAERHRRTAETASAGMFELLSGLVASEEGARGQLAAELHDTVAQSLGLARLELAVGDPDNLRRAADYVDDAEEQVRAVMARTRPPALREGDLASAISGLRAEMFQRYALEVNVTWPESAYPLPLVSAITVYRFFQEALLNVVKHADVEWAEASLSVDEEWVVATVSDAGPGFDPAQVKPERGRHVGLGLLRERARLAGGSLDVSSMPAAGTVLQLRLPRTGLPGRAGEPVLPVLASLRS
jgi:two-component system sensor histidine kinase UhpB